MDLGQQNGTEIFLGYRILLVEKWCGPKSMVVRAIVLGEITKSLLVFGPKLCECRKISFPSAHVKLSPTPTT